MGFFLHAPGKPLNPQPDPALAGRQEERNGEDCGNAEQAGNYGMHAAPSNAWDDGGARHARLERASSNRGTRKAVTFLLPPPAIGTANGPDQRPPRASRRRRDPAFRERLDGWLLRRRFFGALVAKVFHGGSYDALYQRFRDTFVTVKRLKPKASRDKSSETFLIGMQLKKP